MECFISSPESIPGRGGDLSLLKKSLLARIVVYYFLLSLIVVILMGAVSYRFIVRDTKRTVLERIDAFASIKEDALDSWAKEQTRNVVFLSGLPQVRAPSGRLLAGVDAAADAQASYNALHLFFQEVLEYFSGFQEILILDADGGRVAVSTNRTSEGQFRVLDTYFVEGLKGTYIQNIYLSPHSLQPTMTVAHPIRGSNGLLLGVLAVNLNLESMDRIIQETTGLGRTGESYLVDRFNIFVSAERFGRDDFPRGVHSRGIDSAVQGVDGAGIYANYEGIPVLGAYRWIEDRKLALLVEVHEEEAFASVRRQTLLLAVSGIVLILFLAAGVYLLSRQVTAPILTLKRAAWEVAEGNLDVRVHASSRDEIGVLAGSFNRMTVRLKKLYEQLKQREEHFRSLIENSSDIIAVLDARGRIKSISPSAERVTGYRPDELTGTDTFQFIHPDDRERTRHEVFTQMGKGEKLLDKQIEFRFRHKDGDYHSLEAIGTNLLEDPAINGIVVNARDISERRQLEDRLIQAQKMEAVGRLAGGIAHDFNNLLTAIIGYAEVLQFKLAEDRESLDHIVEIRRASERAASLIQQLLAYSRKQVLQLKPMDLSELVRDMEGMLRRLISEDIEMVCNFQAGSKVVKADAAQLQQVILNLTLNARDAMPQGGKLTLDVRSITVGPENIRDEDELSPGEYAVLTIRDSGTGIEPQSLENIFDPFFTTKEVGKGTGLGLATVYGIIKQSRGHITVASQLGYGTTFSIYLPLLPGPMVENSGASGGTEYLRGSESILIAEDEEAVGRIIETVLRHLGYSVQTAMDPDQALEVVKKGASLQLLITDLVMPGMSGQQLASRLLERVPGLKVLYISGYSEDDVVGENGSNDGYHFLKKPFTTDALAKKVREVLEGGNAISDLSVGS
jgi:PAS domain S-box-containing protein